MLPKGENVSVFFDFIKSKKDERHLHQNKTPSAGYLQVRPSSNGTVEGQPGSSIGPQPNVTMEMQRSDACDHFTLTVLRDLQDVADQGAVAVKGLGPREVDGSLLCGAQNRDWVLWSVRKLPVRV